MRYLSTINVVYQFKCPLVLYTHEGINIDNNSKNTSEICRFWYERVYFFLTSALSDTRVET